MAFASERLKGLVSQDSRVVLQKLGELAKERRNAADKKSAYLPRVVIETGQNCRYQGLVLDVRVNHYGFNVLLENPAMTSSEESYLSYIDLREPFNITVLDTKDFMGILRFGDVPHWSGESSKPRLQLKRDIEESATYFKKLEIQLECADELIKDDGVGNCVVSDVLLGIREFFEKTRQDSVGLSALKSIRQIRLERAEGKVLQAQRDGEVLRLRLDPLLGLSEKTEFFTVVDHCL